MGVSTAINNARSAAGVSAPHTDVARPVEEARALHDAIAASSAASQRATEQLCERLQSIISDGGPLGARALLAVEFIDQVRKLGYSEYRMLVGLTNECRSDQSGSKLVEILRDKDTILNGLSQAVPHALQTLEHIYRSQFNERNERALAPFGHDGIDAAFNEKFSEHTMMLLRTVHPLGVNIRTPSWRSVDGKPAYPAEKLIGLQLGGDGGVESAPRRELGAVIVKPKGDTSVVKFIPFGSDWAEVEASAVLRNGESVIVGRSLSVAKSLFEIGLRGSVEVPVGVTMPPENLAWSRGSLFLYRSEDGKSLYILDRGTKSPIVTPDELGAIQTFIPRTVIDMGSVSFGHSISERPRRLGN
ncbi:MAG: hypothetical protein RL417_719 [Pseudomonadota bacterium]|jgi:hypothetical protein